MYPEDPDSDPDHSQNLIISFFYLFRHILKISSKSVHKFLSYLVHKQTNGQTYPGENITSLAEVNTKKNHTFISPMKSTFQNFCNVVLLFIHFHNSYVEERLLPREVTGPPGKGAQKLGEVYANRPMKAFWRI